MIFIFLSACCFAALFLVSLAQVSIIRHGSIEWLLLEAAGKLLGIAVLVIPLWGILKWIVS